MSSYTHLTRDERVKIACLLRAGCNQAAIAKQLGRSPSTISRELNRNRTNKRKISYDVREAQARTNQRRKEANYHFRKIENNPRLSTYIVTKLRQYWSPEQIAGRLKKKHGKAIVSHETIYRFVYDNKPQLKKYLRCQKGKYRRRYGTKKREKKREEAKKRRIDERPLTVEQRERIGDWEGDTIVGNKQSKHRILTHVERKSRYLLADKLQNGESKPTKKKAVQSLNKINSKKRQTITYDNGKEFAQHEMIERKTGALIYFAHPYHSWERGTNENTNGLLRQFFPKSTSLANVTQGELDQVTELINNRPRKCLKYSTPQEVFQKGVAL